jgi:hypothetical protein
MKVTAGLLGLDTSTYLDTTTASTTYAKLDGTNQPFTGRVTAPSLTVDTNTLYVDETNHRVGVGTTAPESALDIINSTIACQLRLATNKTNSTVKFGGLTTGHYLNAEEPVLMMMGSSGATENYINFGGGSSTANTCNIIRFYTAANNTTITGTERMRIQPTGRVGIGDAAPASLLSIKGSSDIVQFKILANSTQTTNLMDIFASDGTTARLHLTGVGNLGVGIAAPTAPLHVYSTPTDTATAFRGIYSQATKTVATDDGNQNAALYAAISTSGAGNYTAENGAIIGTHYFTGTGTLASQNALYYVIGTTGDATGTVTERNGVLIQNYSTSAKACTTSNGVRIKNMAGYNSPTTTAAFRADASTTAVGTNKYGLIIGDQSGATNNYAIYTSLGAVRFGDNVSIGAGAAGTDYTLTFNGETNDGILTWMEDEDYFKFSDGLLMDSTEEIFFRDSAIYVYSSADGWLNLVADTGVEVNAPIVNVTEIYSTNGFDCGDAGGFSGTKYNATDTRLEFYIDGALKGYIGTDGAYVDAVA